MQLFMTSISSLFLIFFVYAVLGWAMESFLKSIAERKFVNRGFLIGPYCPIYGYGALLITIFLQNYRGDLLALFFSSFFLCSILEYVTSYAMEKLFKARWWDYSQKHFQLNGRICLQNSLFFGLGGVLLVRYANPILLAFLNVEFTPWMKLLTGFLAFLFLLDNLVTFFVMRSFKRTALAEIKDDTEEISMQIRSVVNETGEKWKQETKHWWQRQKKQYQDRTEKIKQQFAAHSLLHQRLLSAFPRLQVKIVKKSSSKNPKK